MPRTARKKSKTGIYHVIVRGINRQEIFHDEEDCQRYLEIIKRTKKVSGCKIYGYCLMGNHVHLVVKEVTEQIGQIMKRIGTSYAYWYNNKYDHAGHVFGDRYKSECVEDDRYLMTVIRYIHNNPVNAGMVKKSKEYKWSSCKVYYEDAEYQGDLIEIDTVLGLFSEDKKAASKQFQEFMEQENEDKCLDEDGRRIKASDKEVREEIVKLLEGKPITFLQRIKKEERDEILHQAKKIQGGSIRQISRITGIGYNIIIRA